MPAQYIDFVSTIHQADEKDSDDPFVDFDGAEVKKLETIKEPENQEKNYNTSAHPFHFGSGKDD